MKICLENCCYQWIGTALTLDPSFFTSFLKKNEDSAYQGVLNLSSWSCMSYTSFLLVLILDSWMHTKTFGSFCAGTRWKNGKVHQDLSSQQVLSKGHLSTTSTHGHPWVSLGIDFPRLDHKLVQKQGYELILVVVWYLSKMDHFIPTRTVADAVKLAELFIENILKLKQQGLPNIMISDRDPRFTSKFWKSLFKTLETQLRFSTETDGETDSPQQTLEMMLRRYVKHNLNTWNKNFRILEFAYSSSRHSAMVKSPFSLVY